MLRLHRILRARLAGEAAESPPSMPVGDLLGVKVTLRWRGVPMGAAAETIPSKREDPWPERDLTAVGRKALQRAREKAKQKLEPATQPATAPAEEDTAARGEFAALAPRLQLDLQCAHDPERIRLDAEAPARATYHTYAHGAHGLRLRSEKTDRDGWGWPATALARNIRPRAQFLQLLSAAGLGPAFFEAVGRPNGPRLWRFQAIHVVDRPRRGERAGPRVLVRGHEPTARGALDGKTLEALADSLAAFLRRRQRDNGTYAGPYHPTRDRYDPANAHSRAAALAALALARRAAWREARGEQLPNTNRKAVAGAAAFAAERLLEPEPGPDVDRAAGLGALVMAIRAAPWALELRAERDRAVERLRVRQNAKGRLFAGPAQEKPLPAEEAALVLAALAAQHEQTRDDDLAAAVRKGRSVLWGSSAREDPRALVWLFSVERHVRRRDVGDPLAAQKRRDAAAALEALRQKQVRAKPALGPPDVIGGFDVHLAPEGVDPAAPHPDHRTAWMLSALAGALQIPGWVEEEDRVAYLVDCGLASRFLKRLRFSRSGAYYVRSWGNVKGGVRRAFWDNRLPPRATAATLLAVTRLQASLGDESPF